MNFRIILIWVYLFGELKCTFASETISRIQLAEDSRQKEKEVNHAYEKIQELVKYRHQVEEAAQTESSNRIEAFERHAGDKFSKDEKPLEGYMAKRLWEKAKRASHKYMKIKATFMYEKFCYPPVSVYICETVFQNKFFENEKITYDYSEPNIEDDCPSVYSLLGKDHTGTSSVVQLSMQYKMCRGFKENEDNIKSPVIVYLQSAYKHPLMGGYKYFVIFSFIRDPTTGGWQRSSDLNIPVENRFFRYEAYLSLNKSELKPLS